MKKLLLALIVAGIAVASNAAIFSTNVTDGGIHLLSTNRMNIQSVTISSDQNVMLSLYDSDTLTAPYFGTNYVTEAYPTRIQYATNRVTSFVGQNGITNWYTNAGLWSVTITNAAATNILSSVDFVIGANTAVTYDANILLINGCVMRVNTNASVVILYNTGF